ncbi:hypothetical protein [Streptomyces sp. MNP-20]|uniref:hypothetical protein n=1 Tax=Streptomyces sp. MNP-20 TaxID=2721165 RepID=UPI001553AC84|nr:hypothetical protein [Streptomyces sp. MNP-20]
MNPLGTFTPTGEMTSRGGVVPGGQPFALTSAGPMQCTIGVGRAYITGSTAQGAYPVAVTVPETLTIGDGHGVYPRKDSVILRVYDGLYDTSGQTAAVLEVVQGQAEPNPTAPVASGTAEKLYEITVPAGASAGNSGVPWATAVADRRRTTVAVGGISAGGWTSSWLGSYVGQYRDNRGVLERWDGSQWQNVLETAGTWVTPTLASGYSNDGNNQGRVRYRKITMGGVPHVEWRGGVSWETAGKLPNDGQVLASPVSTAYRPAHLCSVAAAAGGIPLKIDFQTGGVVKFIDNPQVTTWASFTGIVYPIDA